MGRLTKTFRNGECHTLRTSVAPYYKKLSQHEDIEEELGVELETIFDALKNGAYIKGYSTKQDVCLKKSELGGFKLYLCPLDIYEDYVYTVDYGKTWALTKEELE